MKNIAVVLFAYLSFANAVQYFGFTPTISQYNEINGYMAPLEKGGSASVAILITNDRSSTDAINFLAALGVYNTTLDAIESLPADVKFDTVSLEKRAPVQYSCRNAKVRFNDDETTAICAALSGVAGATATSVTLGIKSKSCTIPANGKSTFCTGFFNFVSVAAGGFTGIEVNHYCPKLLNLLTTKCDGLGGVAEGVDGYKLSETVTQTQDTCDNIVGECSISTES